MFDRRPAKVAGWPRDGDHVEAGGELGHPMRFEEVDGSPGDLSAFATVDCLPRFAVLATASGFHFAKDHDPFTDGDEIDLSHGAGVGMAQDAVAFAFEKSPGRAFTTSTQR